MRGFFHMDHMSHIFHMSHVLSLISLTEASYLKYSQIQMLPKRMQYVGTTEGGWNNVVVDRLPNSNDLMEAVKKKPYARIVRSNLSVQNRPKCAWYRTGLGLNFLHFKGPFLISLIMEKTDGNVSMTNMGPHALCCSTVAPLRCHW